jgi:hypothetical protein
MSNLNTIETITNGDTNVVSTTAQTKFLGVTIDTENGPTNPKIQKALNKSYDLLDIMKFIEVTKFKLNTTMFDYFSFDGALRHHYDMLTFGQHGVADYGWKCHFYPGGYACFRMVWI